VQSKYEGRQATAKANSGEGMAAIWAGENQRPRKGERKDADGQAAAIWWNIGIYEESNSGENAWHMERISNDGVAKSSALADEMNSGGR